MKDFIKDFRKEINDPHKVWVNEQNEIMREIKN